MEHKTKYIYPDDQEPSLAEPVAPVITHAQYAKDLKLGMEIISRATPEELHHIILELQHHDSKAELRRQFELHFKAWWTHTCIFSGANLCYNNEHYQALKALGASAIPLLDEKYNSSPGYMQRHILWLKKGIMS